MRAATWLPALVALLPAGAIAVAACGPSGDCEDTATCGKYTGTGTTTTTGTGGGSTSSTGTGGDGGGGGTPAGCVPSEETDPVASECGIFVSSSLGSDSNPGTQAMPFQTIGAALAAANGKPVYACAETFTEAVTISAAVDLYGGLDCNAGWAYVGGTTKTTLTAAADAIPLRLESGANGVLVADFHVEAVNAVADGGSSIAVLADGAAAELVRCELVAGDGAPGQQGTDAPNVAPAQGAQGNPGEAACSSAEPVTGGAQVSIDCGGGNVSIGGKGGDGNSLNGGDGQSGQIGAGGQPGKGEPVAGAWTCGVGGTNGGGNAGDNGAPGDPGLGATGLGTLSSSGYTGTSGAPGMPGVPGQGGGGGGGAKGATFCAAGLGGASGGSGGVGGCGGEPGLGGGPGGASIALVSLSASVTLTDSTLTAATGGEGGRGGNFQPGALGGAGGSGGLPANGSKSGCPGGLGGQGGNGGPGGGGLGGPSLGIAFTGDAPSRQGATTVSAGSEGAGGPGGNANVAANAGSNGAAAEQQSFGG